MRIVWVIGWLAIASACSSHSVRCSKHLRPINGPIAVAAPSRPAGRP